MQIYRKSKLSKQMKFSLPSVITKNARNHKVNHENDFFQGNFVKLIWLSHLNFFLNMGTTIKNTYPQKLFGDNQKNVGKSTGQQVKDIVKLKQFWVNIMTIGKIVTHKRKRKCHA